MLKLSWRPLVLKGVLSILRQFLATESPLKVMRNGFVSSQKLFSFSRYFSFCLDCLVIQQNDLIRKIRLISNFMMSQPGQQTIVTHILPNISISKSNHTIKLGQLIECNLTNIFLEIHTQSMMEKLVPDPFLKN